MLHSTGRMNCEKQSKSCIDKQFDLAVHFRTEPDESGSELPSWLITWKREDFWTENLIQWDRNKCFQQQKLNNRLNAEQRNEPIVWKLFDAFISHGWICF